MTGVGAGQPNAAQQFRLLRSPLDRRIPRQPPSEARATRLADRAEQIAAHLVGYETGAALHLHDTGGRQAAVDFLLEWPGGRRVILRSRLPQRRHLSLGKEGR